MLHFYVYDEMYLIIVYGMEVESGLSKNRSANWQGRSQTVRGRYSWRMNSKWVEETASIDSVEEPGKVTGRSCVWVGGERFKLPLNVARRKKV